MPKFAENCNLVDGIVDAFSRLATVSYVPAWNRLLDTNGQFAKNCWQGTNFGLAVLSRASMMGLLTESERLR